MASSGRTTRPDTATSRRQAAHYGTHAVTVCRRPEPIRQTSATRTCLAGLGRSPARACPVDLWCRLGLDSAMADDRLNRHDLSDSEWALLGPLLPAHPRQGHRWNDHRVVIDGIFHRTRAGCPWRDVPERFGNWKSVYNRHRRWSGDGTWEKILDALRAGCDQAEGTAWTVAADATVVRAHQHAAGGRREPPADVPAERLAVTVLSAPVRAGG